jgi:hypothetical protein
LHPGHASDDRRYRHPANDGLHGSLQEIEARVTARVFAAVHHPERGPAVRAVLEQLLLVLDATSPDGVI